MGEEDNDGKAAKKENVKGRNENDGRAGGKDEKGGSMTMSLEDGNISDATTTLGGEGESENNSMGDDLVSTVVLFCRKNGSVYCLYVWMVL